VTRTADEIQAWIVTRVGALTGIPAEEVDPSAPLTDHGLDSVAVISLAAELERWLGYRFRENPLERHSTIESLARFLAEETRPSGSQPEA
jgi:acyl carrier protein